MEHSCTSFSGGILLRSHMIYTYICMYMHVYVNCLRQIQLALIAKNVLNTFRKNPKISGTASGKMRAVHKEKKERWKYARKIQCRYIHAHIHPKCLCACEGVSYAWPKHERIVKSKVEILFWSLTYSAASQRLRFEELKWNIAIL